MTTENSRADALTDDQIATLKQAALAATPQNIDSAQSIDHYNDGRFIECPCCSGEGNVELEADFLNYDGKALGVQFYGIGNEPGAAEAYFRAASPANILSLLARLESAESALAASPVEQPAPAPIDWCDTMERPKSQCGCPDCGSSLIDLGPGLRNTAPSQADARAPWPMLAALHLEAIVFAYNEGYSKAYDGREFPNPFAESGSQAAAWVLGTRDGKAARQAAASN